MKKKLQLSIAFSKSILWRSPHNYRFEARKGNYLANLKIFTEKIKTQFAEIEQTTGRKLRLKNVLFKIKDL